MTQLHVEGAVLLAMLAAMVLISWGTTGGPAPAAVIGGLLLALGLVAMTALRFTDLEEN